MGENSKTDYIGTTNAITLTSLCIQLYAYSWLFSEEHSGPLGGLIIIPGVAIVFGSLLLHVILYTFFGKYFGIPLIATVAFWTVGLLIPYLQMQARDLKEEKEGQEMMDAHTRRFRERVEPAIKKRYGDSATYFENGFAIRSAAETFTVGYGIGSADMILFIMQPMTTRPVEHDSSMWLKKIELIRPLLLPEEEKWLDSAKNTRTFSIYNSQVSRPEYPLELNVEFKGNGRPFLFETYQEAYPDLQFRITLYTRGNQPRDSVTP